MKPISFRLSPYTEAQLQRLCQAHGLQRQVVVTLALERFEAQTLSDYHPSDPMIAHGQAEPTPEEKEQYIDRLIEEVDALPDMQIARLKKQIAELQAEKPPVQPPTFTETEAQAKTIGGFISMPDSYGNRQLINDAFVKLTDSVGLNEAINAMGRQGVDQAKLVETAMSLNEAGYDDMKRMLQAARIVK